MFLMLSGESGEVDHLNPEHIDQGYPDQTDHWNPDEIDHPYPVKLTTQIDV